MEKQKQKYIEMEKQKQKYIEMEKQKQKQIEMEIKRQKQIEIEMEIKRQKQIEIEMEIKRQKQIEIEMEKQKQIEIEKQKQKQIEMEKQKQIEMEMKRQKQIEIEMEKQKQIEMEMKRQKQIEIEMEKQKQIEMEMKRQKQIEIEMEKQKQIEMEMEKENQIEINTDSEIESELKLDIEIHSKKEMENEKESQKKNNAICILIKKPSKLCFDYLNSISDYKLFILIDDNNYDTSNIKYTNIEIIKILDEEAFNNGFKNSNCSIQKNPSLWDKLFYYFSNINLKFNKLWILESDLFFPDNNTFIKLDNKYNDIDILYKSNVNFILDNTEYFSNDTKIKSNLPWCKKMLCCCRFSKKIFDKIKNYADNNGTLFFIQNMINDNNIINRKKISIKEINEPIRICNTLNSNNTAICLLCFKINIIHINFLNSITNYKIFILCDDNNCDTNFIINTNIEIIKIPDEESYNNGYKNSNCCIKKNPSAWDKVFYYFGKKNLNYDNVWILEDDVFVPNNDIFYNLDIKYKNADLLCKSNIDYKIDNLENKKWSSAHKKHNLPWFKSMVCCCRISKKLFSKIVKYVEQKNELFFIETMIPTIANHKKLSIIEIEELMYIEPKPHPGNRYRQVINGKNVWMTKSIDDVKKNYFYHPVKNLELHEKYRINN
jgi:hypothetical protein